MTPINSKTGNNISPKVQPGDIFCTKNPMWLGRAINAVQKIWADDAESTYSHSGIIINKFGTTIESLWRVKSQALFEAYKGQKVLIGRCELMTPVAFAGGREKIKTHDNDIYPFYRLFFHLIPPLARHINLGRVVCSELTAKFLVGAGIFNNYKGVNPDTIADTIRNYKTWKIIYEGVI